MSEGGSRPEYCEDGCGRNICKMYEACGRLYKAGLPPCVRLSMNGSTWAEYAFAITPGDFDLAGEVSGSIKKILQAMGITGDICECNDKIGLKTGLQLRFERRLKCLARPTKWRKVEFIPNKQYFVPLDSETDDLRENILRIEELEAIRLKDLEGLEQEECAEKMEVSRQTFQRILNTARAKIADSFINVKAIKIEGGNYTRNICLAKCLDCGKEWEESYENFEKIFNGEYTCPHCSSKKIICARNEKKKFCRRNCWRHGRGGEAF